MFNISPIGQLLKKNSDERNRQFDALSASDAANKIESDPISERKAIHATAEMRLSALKTVFTMAALVSEPDHESDLLPSEILDDLMTSAFSEDDADDDSADGDIDATLKAMYSAHVADALATMGVEDDVIDDIFGDDIDIADSAIEKASEEIIENMPDDEDFSSFIDEFVYGINEEYDDQAYDSLIKADNEEAQFDGATKKKLRVGKKSVKTVNGHEIVYKAVKAIRNGKKVVVNKRMTGNIVLTSKQKAALRKARRKAGNPAAIRKQMKSFGKGLHLNIYKMTEAQKAALTKASLKRHSKSFGI
ncbi:MAG: hypothetical protein Q4P13_05975 [Psychrobacter sp.]|nr:hypothetical protein [Psychrobacter sp.]